jgi:hypothetical protein
MIDLLFLVCWTVIFLLAGVFVWMRIIANIRVYLLLILHFIFLAGIFYFYPMILEISVKS